MIKKDELDSKLILNVLLVGLRRHPQEQYTHTTPLSEKWIYSLGEGQNVGPIPMASDAAVMYPPDNGGVGPECTNSQYIAYGESTVCTDLCILYLGSIWVPSLYFLLSTKKG
jgi:hypothetical protein